MRNKKEILKLTSDLVSFKTVHPDEKEIVKCIEYIKNFFRNSDLYIKEFEFNGTKSVVISNHKSTKSDIIFCGHIDVVPAEESLFKVKEQGDILHGRGVSDMKGQVAVMMNVMKSLYPERTEKKVTLFLTSDEERGGFNGTGKLLSDQNYTSKVAIVPDGGFDYTLVVESKGVLQIKVTAKGTSCHSSEVWNGKNAILKLFDVFNQIVSKFPMPQNNLDWKTSFNLAKIEGGDYINKVPGEASMYIDVRHTYLDTMENIIGFIKKQDESLEIEVLARGNAFHVNKDNIYVKKYVEVCESLTGKEIEAVNYQAASDGRFFTEKNIPCVIMNPVGGNIHCANEFVSLNSLCTLEKIYKKYIKERILS
jgi:succinyl-diaminopimelate desuccinylase